MYRESSTVRATAEEAGCRASARVDCQRAAPGSRLGCRSNGESGAVVGVVAGAASGDRWRSNELQEGRGESEWRGNEVRERLRTESGLCGAEFGHRVRKRV